MNTTALQDLTNGVAGLLSTNILPAIAKGLKDTKGLDVTLEELAKWCNLPMNRSLMPAMGFGGAVPTPVSTTAVSTTGAKKKPGTKVEVKPLLRSDGTPETSTGKPFIEGKSCRHFYEKGAVNQGKYCGKDVVKGTFYCSNKTHKDKENKQKVSPGIAPSIDVVEPEDNGDLAVQPYDEARGLFREVNHDFIVKEGKLEGEIISLGKLYSDNTIKPLTENEKIIARALGITVPDIDLNNVVEEQTAPVISKVPSSIPQMPSSIPQMPSSIPQMPSSIPQMPMSVPQMPMSIPQMPSSIPQMPMSIPQMPSSIPQMPRQQVPQFPGVNPK